MKDRYVVLGISGLLSGYCIFMWTFFTAVFNNGIVMVNVNYFGEMWYEVVILLALLPFVLIFVYKVLWSERPYKEVPEELPEL